MNSRHEDSLMFSLAELRSIEDDRIAEEQATEQAAKDAEAARRLAQEHEALLAEKRACERLKQETREREREREDSERAARIAVEERERLARVAAEERIARERLLIEISAAPSSRRQSSRLQLALFAAASATAVVLAVFYVRTSSQLEESRAHSASNEAELRELATRNRQLAAENAVSQELAASLDEQLKLARSSAAKTPSTAPSEPAKTGRGRRRTRDARRDASSVGSQRGSTSGRATVKVPKGCKPSDGPLCGIPSSPD